MTNGLEQLPYEERLQCLEMEERQPETDRAEVLKIMNGMDQGPPTFSAFSTFQLLREGGDGHSRGREKCNTVQENCRRNKEKTKGGERE